MTDPKTVTITLSPPLACTTLRDGEMCGRLAGVGIATLRYDERWHMHEWQLQTICRECVRLW